MARINGCNGYRRDLKIHKTLGNNKTRAWESLLA